MQTADYVGLAVIGGTVVGVGAYAYAKLRAPAPVVVQAQPAHAATPVYQQPQQFQPQPAQPVGGGIDWGSIASGIGSLVHAGVEVYGAFSSSDSGGGYTDGGVWA